MPNKLRKGERTWMYQVVAKFSWHSLDEFKGATTDKLEIIITLLLCLTSRGLLIHFHVRKFKLKWNATFYASLT